MIIFRISIAFCLVFLIIVIELIRRKKLEERYSILWFVVGIIMLILSLFPRMLEQIARLLHVVYAPSVLFFLGFIFSLIIILHLTTVISRMHRKMTRLIQEVALLKREQEDMDPVNKKT
ncbi:DUF2304 domain-containing protein [Paenibacillus sp. N1-5-1-14]|uniref:DUF2304 domain-containing protein n=1 Tax=Paenibacillus radicibacter TaxID=2972488 RepID=UPI0021595C17|nr:DUF2304 domain-containing protein [Paenibacillus radicibacter]MCR8643147.1 DUF2304 domain-containing protein [Paenibacillus radicibacter]